ncbi:MAG TPA: hypothetical protein VGD60_15350, partial [Candidatus Acidoferrales bacterium]
MPKSRNNEALEHAASKLAKIAAKRLSALPADEQESRIAAPKPAFGVPIRSAGAWMRFFVANNAPQNDDGWVVA